MASLYEANKKRKNIMYKLKERLMDEDFGSYEGCTGSSGAPSESKKKNDSNHNEDSKTSDSPSYDSTAITTTFFSTMF